MSSIARGGFARLSVVAAALAAAIACSGGSTEDGGPWSAPVREQPRLVAPSVTPSLPRASGGSSAGALTCPDAEQIVCGSVCCPAGTICASGECRVPVDVQECPAEAPLACDTPVSCASGCAALDHSGRGNHLAVAAPAGFGEGRAGGAITMNRIAYGLPEQLVTGPAADLRMDRTTVEVWISPGQYLDPNDWQAIYVHAGQALLVKPRGIQFGGCTIELGPLRTNGTGDPLGAGMGWHFIAVTVDGTAFRFYLDSRPVGSCAWAGTPAFPSTGGQVQVGTNTNASASFSKYQFQGAIDELRILDHARSEAQIQEDYALARLPVIAGTRALWRFDEGSRRRCCPAGTTCGAGGGCAASGEPRTCAGDYAVACDGYCCPNGSTCAPGGCSVRGIQPGCAVSCGDGTCCPSGYQCSGSSCVLDPGTLAGSTPCPAGDIAVEGGDGTIRCCASAGAGSTIAFATGGLCAGCYAVGAGFGTCPAGYAYCQAEGKCIRSADATYGATPCAAGLLAVDGGDGRLRCCSDPGPGSTIAFAAGGACAGCYAVGAGLGSCPAGYSYCYAEGKCIRAAEAMLACGAGEAVCAGSTHAAPGGCCAQGSDCLGGGRCCADGEVACGGTSCCSAAECVAGICTRPKGSACATPLCGDVCCSAGTSCAGTTCVADVGTEPVCATGTPCGATCCADGERCASTGVCEEATAPTPSCPGELPVACGGGIGCCPASYVCPAWSGDVCRYAGAITPTAGPDGPTCSDTTACAAGQVCTGAGCCPADHPLACGTQCCLPGAACVDGACACPDGRPACNGTCCGNGMSCVNGVCSASCADPEFPLTCGEYCCSPKYSCVSGDCACRGDHPVECGDGCCLAGATCGASGCGCPESTPTACGEYCCAPGQQCLQCPGQAAPSCRDTPCPLNCPSGSHQSGNACVCDTPGHWLSTCPGGSKKCCLTGMSCCYSAFGGPADCTPDAWCN